MAIESFGYKHGLPLDADIVMDVRFLPNPHWDDDLRPLTGLDQAVRDYVLETAAGQAFLDRFDDLLAQRAPAVPGRGPELPDGGDRVHGRSPPIGRRSPRNWRDGSATGASPCARPTATSPSPADARRRTGPVRAPVRSFPVVRVPALG